MSPRRPAGRTDMGFLDFLPIVGKVIDKLIPDPAAKAEMQLKLATLAQAGEFKELDAQVQLLQGQIDINKIEAASDDKFKSRWRPAIGWVCAISLFCYYVPYTLAATVMWIVACWHSGTLMPRPDLGIADLMGLVATLLGMGTLRSFDKKQGQS